MTGAELTPWIPSRTKGRRARTPLARGWCSVRQYAYHDMHSLRIAPGLGHPFRFTRRLGLRFYLEVLVFCDKMNAKAASNLHTTAGTRYLQPFLRQVHRLASQFATIGGISKALAF